MYHLAKIVEVYSPTTQTASADTSVQAQLEMWDENLLVFGVHPSIAAHAQKGQYVLVEYGFHAPQIPHNSIIKILDPKIGEASWKRVKNYYEKKQKGATAIEMGALESPADQRMVR